MNHLTQTEALAEGLSVINPVPALDAAPTPAARAGLASILADRLAAAVNTLAGDRDLTHHQRVALDVILQGLGALHVECDELSQDLYEVAALAGLLGVA